MGITSIKDIEIQIKALWARIDGIVNQLTDAANKEAIRAAVATALQDQKDKEIARKDKWIKLIWIPIALLIISNIVAWLFNFLPTGG